MNLKIMPLALVICLSFLLSAQVQAAHDSFRASSDFTLANVNGHNDIVTDMVIKNGATANSWTMNSGDLRVVLEAGSNFKLASDNNAIGSIMYGNPRKCMSFGQKGYASLKGEGSYDIEPREGWAVN